MNLNKGYFIIGTDTGIGKTYVSTLLYQGIKKQMEAIINQFKVELLKCLGN